MTVFKAFLRVLNKNKFVIIMYTVILIAFGGFNMQTSDTSTSFVAEKPDVFIVNQDEKIGITKNLIEYIEDNTNIVSIKDEKILNDALFYRDVNYIIYIPAHFREDFLQHKSPQIKVKSTGDYQASLAEMILERYLKIANIYLQEVDNEEALINYITNTLATKPAIHVTSKLDVGQLSKATFYYNFASYSILAGCVYVICLILSSFNAEKIRKRTMISSCNDSKYQRQLLLSNGLFAFVLWLFYILLSFILIGQTMLSIHGIIFMLNSFLFTFCALTIAFLIGNLVNNKGAINGIVNVIALGSSFLCGAFVPMEWLPNGVLMFAHFLPSYYYIKSNELLSELEIVNFQTLQPIFKNMLILLVFSLFFIIITNLITNKKRKV